MSYAKSVKQELTKLKLRGAEEKKAQLFGLTHAAGALRLGREPGLEYVTEVNEVGRQIAALSTSLYEVEAVTLLRESGRAKLTAVVLQGPGAEALLTEAGLFRRTGEGALLLNEPPCFKREEARRAFLRGVYLGAGSISNPKRAYHLELVCRNEPLAAYIAALLREFELEVKTVRRKEKIVVYLKDGDLISMLLALLGANTSTLSFEDARVEKDLRNYINRTSNCETANIGKTVNASYEQVEAIRGIIANKAAFARLTPKLREAAELRLNYPEMSLSELAQLAGIGRSGMNHRLQRLMKSASFIQKPAKADF